MAMIMKSSCPTHEVPLESSPYDDGGVEKDFCPQCEMEWESAWDAKIKTNYPSLARPLVTPYGTVSSVARGQSGATWEKLNAPSAPSFLSSLSVPTLVGGLIMPVKKLATFAPYMALFGLAAVAVAVAKPWKRD
jgi:hypothetical protein